MLAIIATCPHFLSPLDNVHVCLFQWKHWRKNCHKDTVWEMKSGENDKNKSHQSTFCSGTIWMAGLEFLDKETRVMREGLSDEVSMM